jgi:UDP-N-acetylglucosamine acyltransferase
VSGAIHPSAVVDAAAEIGAGVEIGPFAIVGAGVRLGDRVRVGHHASVLGPSSIGADTHIFPFASVGSAPQDLSYRNEPTRLEVGERNVFREFVTINRGTVKGGGLTRIGSDCFFMAYAHVAHDSTIGSHVIMANCAALAGHIRIDDHAILGGLVAVHQWARVGRMAMIGGVSGVALDVPPFCIASGERAKLYGLNLVGLKRHGFSEERIADLKRAYRLLFRAGLTLKAAIDTVEAEVGGSAEAAELLEFIRTTKRGITR